MRSDLVYDALQTVQNRYLLCQVASRATRQFHRPNTRIQDTTNEVLTRISTVDRTHLMREHAAAVAQPHRRAA